MKTLGVKFQVAGVKEAQAGLNNLRNSLNQSLEHNKKVATQTLQKTAQIKQDTVTNLNQVTAQGSQKLKKAGTTRFEQVKGGYFEGIGAEAGRQTYVGVQNLFRRIVGLGEQRDTVHLSEKTIGLLATAIGLTTSPKARAGISGNLTVQNFSQSNGAVVAGGNNGLLDSLLMPFRTIKYSFFEGIGSFFGDKYARGFNQVLNDKFDLDFERKGQVGGLTAFHVKEVGIQDFVDNVEKTAIEVESFQDKLNDGTASLATFSSLIKQIAKSMTILPSSAITGHRKSSVEIEGVRKLKKLVKEIDEADLPDLTGKKRVLYTFGGFAAEKGNSGFRMADEIRRSATDDTAVIGASNENSDLNFSVFGNKALWATNLVQKISELNLKGYNDDSVKGAAEIIALLHKYPDLKEIRVTGHSAGGFNVEEIQEMLDLLGYSAKIKTIATGTPRTIGGLNNPRTQQLIGDNDDIVKEAEAAGEFIGLTLPRQGKDLKDVASHYGEDYLTSESYLKSVLGQGFDQEKNKQLQKSRSPLKGRLIELETLYVNYLAQMDRDLEDLMEELSVAPDRLIAKSRRAKLRDRGANAVDRKLRTNEFRNVELKEGTETVVLLAGGLGGAYGRSGAAWAKTVRELDGTGKTQYVGVRNPFTDVLTPDDIRGGDTNKGIIKTLENFVKVQQIGYNPDSIEIAAQIVDILHKDPDVKVKFAGYSAGGYIGEDVVELLKARGVDMSRVEMMGIGTPDLPGGLKNRQYDKLLGDKDPIAFANRLKEINNQIKDILGLDVFPQLMKDLQNIEGIENHDLNDYIAQSKEVQDFFYGNMPHRQEVIENYLKIQEKMQGGQDIVKEQKKAFDIKDPQKKFAALKKIRERYINLFQEIYTLANQAEKLGGGKYFVQQKASAKSMLAEYGIVVPQERPPANQPTPEVSQTRGQQLASSYKNYLQNLFRKTRRDSAISTQIVARDFAGLDRGGQTNYLQQIKGTFNAKAKAYRQAVKNGQLELAQKNGEDLLVFTQLIKGLYGEIKDFSQLDPQVKRNFQNYQRYISSVQTEVLQGSNAKGRTNRGLPDLFAGEVDKVGQDGSNVAQGFIEGILNTLAEAAEAGEDLVDAVEEGIRDRGEIRSPSRLAQRLGRWLARGFGLGIASENLEERGREVVNDAAEGFKDQVKASFDPDNIASLLDTGGAGLIKKLGSLLFDASQNDGFEEVIGIIGDLTGKIIRLVLTFKLLKVALKAMGLGKLIEGFRNLPEEAINAAIAVEALDKRIVDMSGSARSGAKNLEFITKEAARLNRNLTDAKENFSQILRATRDTSLEGFQTENIYTAFAATAKSNALSQADQQQLFRSVRSMIGKGILSQEEVRQEIGERLGDFEQSLAEAYGVSRPQLNKMIENREVRATEALPKVAAVLRAKNDISGELDTGAAAVQRVDNSIQRFRESVGNALLPLQKFGNNFLAGFFAKLGDLIDYLEPLVNGFFIALFGNLLRLEIFGQSVQKILLGLIKLLWTMKRAIAIFAAEIALFSAAWAAWENVLKIFSSRYFPEINKDIAEITRGLKAYRLAIEEAKGATEELGNSRLQLAEGFKLPDNQFGDLLSKGLGSDYLNLDSLVRQPIDKVIGNKYAQKGAKTLLSLLPGGSLFVPFVPQKFTSRREQKEQQLKIGNSRLALKGNQLLGESTEAFAATQEIKKYDAQIAEIQSARLKLLPGDTEGLKASLAKEQKINQERDKQLRILSNYQQTLQTSINAYKSRLEDIEQRFLKGEIDQDTYTTERDNLQGLLGDTEDELKKINQELSKVSTRLSEFQRRLRNSNERVEGFLAQADRQLQQQRAGIIEEGIAEGAGTQVIQLQLEEAQQQDLERRINLLKKEIAAIEDDLDSPELEAGVRRIKQSLAANNIPLNETSLQRIIEESPVKEDRDAAQGLLERLRRQTQLTGIQEQLATTLQQTRNATIDFNRTITDYFNRITQQIKEAQLETKRLLAQLFYTDLKNKLRAALAPGSNTFVNGVIDSIQSVIDQASQVAQKVFGDKSADLGFESESRNLAMELKDFIRQIGNAGEAVENFTQRLNGSSPSSPSSPSSNLDALRRAIIGKESGANFKAVNPHSGALGYGQVMPANVPSWTKAALGKSLTSQQFLNDADAQIKVINFKLNQYLQKELAQGFDVNTAVRRVASTWYSGRPNLYNDTRPQTYGAGSYPSIDSYTRDILKRFQAEGGGSNRPQLVSSSNQSQNNSPIADKALKVNQQLLQAKQKNLTISKRTTEQEREALAIQVKQTIAANKRSIAQAQKENQRNLLNLESKFAGFGTQYNYQSAAGQLENNLRSLKQQFLDTDSDSFNQLRNTEDAIKSITNEIPVLTAEIARLKAIGTPEANAIVRVKESALAGLTASLPQLEANLVKIKSLQKDSHKLEIQYSHFLTEQGKLKIEQEKLTRKNVNLGLKANILAARGTLEQQRQVKLETEKLRLQLRINEIRQTTPPGVYRDELILNELEQSKSNKSNINLDSQTAELNLEKKLLDLDSGIGDKQAGFLSRYGFDLQANKLRRDKAVAAENNRFQRELVQLEKDFAGQADLIAQFTQKARELNRVNLKGIEQQFKSLKDTVQDFGISAVQGFFSNVATNFFDGAAQREQGLREERLRYAEELNQLNSQYKEEEGKLAHLKNRARELNETKLDKINNQFNIFGRVVDLARQALLEFVKQIALMVAKQAAAKFLSSILGSALGGIGGGATGNDFGAGIGTAAFTASQGITVGEDVPNYSKGGSIKSRKLPNRLTSYFRTTPGVKKAYSAEGKGARLGVFHVGEELLSQKTGEAPVYQALKRKYGFNPLQKLVPYFEMGGSVGKIESNILSGFGSGKPKIDLSGLSKARGQSTQSSRTVTLNQTVVTPNADSFNLNQDQRNQDLLESLRRGV